MGGHLLGHGRLIGIIRYPFIYEEEKIGSKREQFL